MRRRRECKNEWRGGETGARRWSRTGRRGGGWSERNGGRREGREEGRKEGMTERKEERSQDMCTDGSDIAKWLRLKHPSDRPGREKKKKKSVLDGISRVDDKDGGDPFSHRYFVYFCTFLLNFFSPNTPILKAPYYSPSLESFG
ncbi:hypothetical protein NL108_008945 [Boleophthalmus pectinirostris]|nr:hypothetical protein NL108_008945 [Boleophthalmus pectinirostris]